LKTLNTNSIQASGLKILGSLGGEAAINGTEPSLAVLHPLHTPKVQSRSQPKQARILLSNSAILLTCKPYSNIQTPTKKKKSGAGALQPATCNNNKKERRAV